MKTRTLQLQYWTWENMYVGRIDGVPETLQFASSLEMLEAQVVDTWRLVQRMANPTPTPTVQRKTVTVEVEEKS